MTELKVFEKLTKTQVTECEITESPRMPEIVVPGPVFTETTTSAADELSTKTEVDVFGGNNSMCNVSQTFYEKPVCKEPEVQSLIMPEGTVKMPMTPPMTPPTTVPTGSDVPPLTLPDDSRTLVMLNTKEVCGHGFVECECGLPQSASALDLMQQLQVILGQLQAKAGAPVMPRLNLSMICDDGNEEEDEGVFVEVKVRVRGRRHEHNKEKCTDLRRMLGAEGTCLLGTKGTCPLGIEETCYLK